MTTGTMIDGVHRTRLDNGLTVLARHDDSAPVVAVVLWVRSGYFQESDEQVGLAHVCEHMYFNGTQRRPGPEDIAREIKSLGGELNAGTYYDFTAYHVVLPADRLERALDVQADALSDPLMDAGVLEKEMGAIIQEARRKLDNPAAVARERMHSEGHDLHRIRRWRIGTEEQLRGYGPDDLKAFWAAHYVPSNVVVSVVGDVEVERASDAVRAAFGGLAAGSVEESDSPAEPERQPGLRYGSSAMDVADVTGVVGFPAVPDDHPDAPALSILAAILTGGRSSRLVRELRERRRLLSSISANAHGMGDMGFLDFSYTTSSENLEALRPALFEALAQSWHEEPTEEEMERARTAVRAGFVFGAETMLGQSRTLARFEAMGGYERIAEEVEALLSVSPADVLRVARTWLRPERAAWHEVLPESLADEAPEAADLGEVITRAAGPRPEPAELSSTGDTQAAPSVLLRAEAAGWTDRELGSGVRLVHRCTGRNPTVTVAVTCLGGQRGDLGGRAGWTQLGAGLLPRGTRSRDSESFAKEIELLGTSVGGHASDDGWGLAVSLLSEHAEAGAELLFDALTHPAFDPDEVSKAVELQVQAQRRLQDQPLAHALQLGRAAAFGEQLWGLPDLGEEESLASVSPQALADWHSAQLHPSSLCAAVVGDLSFAEAERLVEDGLAGARWGSAPEPAGAPTPEFHEGGRREVSRKKQQSAQALLFPGVPAGHQDALPLELVAACCSSLGGRFFEEVRTRRGLAYVVAAGAAARREAGWFTAFLATAPEDAERAREVLLHETRRLVTEPPRGEELSRAQEYLAGRHVLGLQGHAAQAGQALHLLGLGRDLSDLETRPARLRAATSEDLAAVAERHLDPERAALGLVRAEG